MLRSIILILLAFCTFTTSWGQAGFTDDFTDGNFTVNPTWVGETSKFQVNAQELQLNDAGPSSPAYLATASTIGTSASWEFKVRLVFDPSTSNFAQVYLISNNQDLTQPLDGYYVKIGGQTGTVDEVSLYRQDGNTEIEIIDGIDGTVATAPTLKVRVIRDVNDNWELLIATSAPYTNFVSQGTTLDNTYSNSSYFGVYCRYTTTRSDKFFFDDFLVSGTVIQDVIKPKIAGVDASASDSLLVDFDEAVDVNTATNTLNYTVSKGVGNPSSVVIDQQDSSKSILVFSPGFTNGESYELFTQNVKDRSGNIMENDTTAFTYFVPEKPDYRDVVINELMPDPTPVVGLPEAEFIELFNASNKIFDLSSWTLTDGTSTATLPSFLLQPNEFLIICPSSEVANFQPFGQAVGVSSFPTLNNSGDLITLRDEVGNTIDAVNYTTDFYKDPTKTSGGYTLEQINPFTDCIGITNFSASNDAAGGTPGQANSVLNLNSDTIGPELLSAEVISADSIILKFNERLDTALARTANYSFSTSAAVGSVKNQFPDFQTVLLSLSNPLESGIINTITVTNLADCSGNLIGSTNSANMVLPATASYRDVVLNELFPSPSPSIGLPEAEFIELFNASNTIFDLSNWTLTDGSSTATLPSFILQPNEFLIICPSSELTNFQPFGQAIGVSSFPTLNNSGDLITLRDEVGNTIDEVNYTIDFYDDPSKSSGGYSLEQINPFTDCIGITNFAASNDSQGGTPGQTNSILNTTPESIAPELISAEVLSRDSILLKFNERLDTASVKTANYSFSTSAAVGSVQNQFPDFQNVLLSLSTPLDSGVVITISVSNLRDCAGNLIDPANSTKEIIISPAADFREIVINELLPDPSPTIGLPDAEFIELYNASTKTFDLSNWTISGSTSSSTTLPTQILRPNEYLIICASSSAAQFEGFGKTLGTSISTSFLTNDGKELFLKDNTGKLIDYISYTDSWYRSDAKSEGGYSLEQINPTTECSGIINFSASDDASGGTPGRLNSIFDTSPDLAAPELLSAAVLTPNEILLNFNEFLDTTSVLSANYSFSTSEPINQVFNLPPSYQSLLLQLSTPIDTGIVSTISVSNIRDCAGNIIDPNSTVDVVLSPAADFREIVINELLPDPSPALGLPDAEFIELYNASTKTFDLSNWTISGSTSSSTALPTQILRPNEYLIICASSSAAQFEGFGKTLGTSISPSFLTNDSKELFLKDNSGKLIDYISYTDSWYRSDAKSEGGYSLEQINPTLPCTGASNFIASTNRSGGTPGQANSVRSVDPDITALRLLNSFVLAEDSILLVFNEGIDTASALSASYDFSNQIKVDRVINIPFAYHNVMLVLDRPLIQKEIVELKISNISDCSGNAIVAETKTLVALPEEASPNDLVINEILYNPRSGGVDFIEVYNRSEKVISLENWALDNTDVDTLSNQKNITTLPYLIFPGGYRGFTQKISNIVAEYPLTRAERFIQMNSLPSYSDQEGTVVLLNQENVIIDQVSYRDDQQFALLNDDDGVSLERIDPNRASDDESNFHSAAESVGFATPGYQNSQYFINTRFDGTLTIDPETFSPDNDGFQDVLNINYQFSAPGYAANVDIYDRYGRLIKSLVRNELLGSTGSLSWDGITDDGQKARIGIYVIFFEAFNASSGDKQEFKETVVVAGNLD